MKSSKQENRLGTNVSSKQENRLGTNVSAKQMLDKISRYNYQNSMHPRFAKEVDLSFSKGYIKGYVWVDEMCSYYFKIEKSLVEEFQGHLQNKLDDIKALPESRYKDGLKESIENALKSMKL